MLAAAALLAHLSLASSGLACHGRGRLNGRFECECDPLFNGTHCEGCLCVNGVCPPRGLGPYGAQTQCQCTDSWTGPLCDFCCAIPGASSCAHVTDSEHSQLQCRGSECARHYYGARCNIFCEPEFTCGSKDARCRDDGSCSCTEPSEGWDADAGRCAPCPADEAGKTCSGHGSCTDGPTCVCDDGYSGRACDDTCCPKAAAPDVVHTTCGADGGCQCKSDGYDVFAFVPEHTCQYECPGTSFDASRGLVLGRVCSGHGECQAADGAAKCVCRDGYKGAACNCAPTTCANGGVCDDALGARHLCVCATTYDPGTDCRTCRANWTGTDCQRFCAPNTCASGASCAFDGQCAACPSGTNKTIHVTRRSAAQAQPTVSPVGAQRMTLSAQPYDYAQVVVDDAFVVANLDVDSGDEIIVDFGDRFESSDAVALRYVDASGCDKCNDDFYPPPDTPGAYGTCTTYCTRSACTSAGTCNATTGACVCDANVTGQFCENCVVPWGPAPGGAETPCTQFCSDNATTWEECLARRDGRPPQLDKQVECDAPCAYNFTDGRAGQVTCVSQGVTHNCTVPSSPSAEERNEDAYGSTHALVTFAGNATRVEPCAFCSAKGRCLLGTCTCGRRVDVEDRNQYHGRHCTLTCTAPGISTPCSGHGVCAWYDRSKPPRCLCDGAVGSAASFVKRCEEQKQCGTPPPADYFGLYCNKSAPVRYIRETDNTTRESICSGHPFLKLTAYDVVLGDDTQGYVNNVQCSPGVDAATCCGAEATDANHRLCDERSDVYCDEHTRLCTKLQCSCPNNDGGGNCGTQCPYSMMSNCGRVLNVTNASAPSRQVCAQSTCGHELPHLNMGPDEAIILAPCSRGVCRPIDNATAGNTPHTPSPNAYPVPGQCHCYLDPGKSRDCRTNETSAAALDKPLLKNESLFVQQCCGKGDHHYGGSKNNYCGQDCQCDPAALSAAPPQGQCESPYSSKCECADGFCGIGCAGKCNKRCISTVPYSNQNITYGACFAATYSTCACDCTGGYIQKTHAEFGFADTRARLFVGPSCNVECVPENATTINRTLPTFDDDFETQADWLHQYLDDMKGRCSGHGICGYDSVQSQASCICDNAHTGASCDLTCFDDNLMANFSQTYPLCVATQPTDYIIEECGYKPCPHGSCSQSRKHDGQFSFRCVPDAGTTSGPSMVNTSDICPCDDSSDTYMWSRCLCGLPQSFHRSQTQQPYDRHFAYAFGIMKSEDFSSCKVCDQQLMTVPTANCRAPFISSGISAAANEAYNCVHHSQCDDFGVGKALIFDSARVPMATQFALLRDCAVNYADVCGALGIYQDDYYWVTHEQFACVCDTTSVFVQTDQPKCDVCSLYAGIEENCEQTAAGEFFMDAASNQCAAKFANFSAEQIPDRTRGKFKAMSLHLPDGASQAIWPVNMTHNARWNSHTFCNRRAAECNPHGELLMQGNVQPQTAYVGQFNCSHESYRSAFGYNCVRNRTLPPVVDRYAALPDQVFGEYGEFSFNPSSAPQIVNASWRNTIAICTLLTTSCTLTVSNDNYKRGVPFAATSGVEAQYYEGTINDSGKNVTLTPLRATFEHAQCYNAHAYYMGNNSNARSLCAYAMMYGFLRGGNARLPNVDEFCDNVTTFLSLSDSATLLPPVQIANPSLPMMMTGDSCRDMLLHPDYVDAYYERYTQEIDAQSTWRPFAGSVEFPNNTNVTGFARLNDAFDAVDVGAYDGPLFIVPRDVALDYWCNPTSGLCESGRSFAVEKDYSGANRSYVSNPELGFEIASSNGDVGHYEDNVVSTTFDPKWPQVTCAPFQKQLSHVFFDNLVGQSYVASAFLCNASLLSSPTIVKTQLEWVHYDAVQWFRCGNNTAAGSAGCAQCNAQQGSSESVTLKPRQFDAARLCQDLLPPANSSDYALSTPNANALQIFAGDDIIEYPPLQYKWFVHNCTTT